MRRVCVLTLWAAAALSLAGCPFITPPDTTDDPAAIAEGIQGRLGDPIPTATETQLATFERGKAVFNKRFDLADGVGPAFNVTFCGACHEKPAAGGSAALYRNFFLAGRRTIDGAFLFSESAGMAGGVVRMFRYEEGQPARPGVEGGTTIFAQRNPIPMFGAGLLAEISDDEILSRVDPDDADGDGISGRANFDRGFVGRFGRKSQTVSIEGFIRGPLFNHLGITTVPLSEELRAQLPVDSSLGERLNEVAKRRHEPGAKLGPHMQAAAPDAPNFDDDGAADPEMTEQELFDLVSFSMLLAAPKFDEPTEQTRQGEKLFEQANCTGCHVPRIKGPRGPIPAYSDLLIHDMGPELADGIEMLDASGSEFRTQPLWGLSATAPYLHDGRASTIHDAILAHGGEAAAARDAYAAFTADQQADVQAFLRSLGGSDQKSTGLMPPNTAMSATGDFGGPLRDLSPGEQEQFLRGREMFDRDFNFSDGVGALTGKTGTQLFNGDSCRACHFDPVIGGSGPRGVSVMRHGTVDENGDFAPPLTTANTILHKESRLGHPVPDAEDGINVFQIRQTPPLFGLGLLDAVADETILAAEDPNDEDGDGISGRAHVFDDGRIGRFGWKADVPTLAEFVRDAMGAELGLTMAPVEGMTFGVTADDDGVPDPEMPLADAADLEFFMRHLAPPPRQPAEDAALVANGEALFETVGCTKCHTPSLPTSMGPARAYTDLLLHEIMPPGTPGIVSGDARQREFRTAPLWGISQSAPYFHDGSADTLKEAIQLHDGEAAATRDAFEALDAASQEALLAFLRTL